MPPKKNNKKTDKYIIDINFKYFLKFISRNDFNIAVFIILDFI